jgi:hypothetical protein
MGEIQSALRRVEGMLGEMLAEQRNNQRQADEAKAHHIKHEEENRQDFALVYEKMDSRFTDQTEDRQRHMNEQDVRLVAIAKDVGKLQNDNARAKGVGGAIIGILSAVVLFIGGAVLAAVEGVIHIKIG